MPGNTDLNNAELLTKTNGAAADATAWHVIDRTKDFSGDVFEVTVESQSGHEQWDGMQQTVDENDIEAGKWEIVE